MTDECPHCKKEINAKELLYNEEDETWTHKNCGGIIYLGDIK